MLKCCLSPDLALKQPMPFLSPPHVPALFTYPTTPGIVKVYVSFVEILSWYRDSLYLTERLCKPGFVFLVLHHIFMWWLDSDVTFLASRPFFSFVFCPAAQKFARRSCAMPHTTVWPSTQTWAHGKSDRSSASSNKLYEWRNLAKSITIIYHECQLILAVYNK